MSTQFKISIEALSDKNFLNRTLLVFSRKCIDIDTLMMQTEKEHKKLTIHIDSQIDAAVHICKLLRKQIGILNVTLEENSAFVKI